jgi:membrane protease YdiL (CAAX protease family)
MPVSSGNPVEIYRASGLPEAYAVRFALERAGISASVENEMLQNAVGGILAGWSTAPRVVVGSADEAAARAIIEEFMQRRGGAGEGEEKPLHCLACGAPMGEPNACPACGWSYGQGLDAPHDEDLNASPTESAVSESLAGGAGRNDPPPPVLARGVIWGEVGAVLAVAFVPSLLYGVYPLRPPPHYWFDALDLTLRRSCVVFVTLYLIYRGGETWGQFGLPRPALRVVPIGIGMYLIAEALWQFCCGQIPWHGWPPSGDLFPRPRQPADYALMVLKFGANGFAEELVYRAYLITRLELLLRSRGLAVLLSAALFGAGHSYQGPAGVAYTVAFGVAYGAAFVVFRQVWPLAIGHALYNIRLELVV